MNALAASCDTSVLVPALLSWHSHHEVARTALAGADVAVPAHAIVEAYSSITRMPAHLRLAPSVTLALLDDLADRVVTLDSAEVLPTLRLLALHDIAGGATYDAMIAATALAHGLVLLSMDRRARHAYDAVGVQVRYLA
jgi:predicted nucleic acid-binding protein